MQIEEGTMILSRDHLRDCDQMRISMNLEIFSIDGAKYFKAVAFKKQSRDSAYSQLGAQRHT